MIIPSLISRDAEESDKELLTRAAMGVVLQREISLTRRVYTWLLGSDETSEGQIAHFNQYGLDLLSSTIIVSTSFARAYS